MNTAAPKSITPAHDGARILWRRWRAADDTVVQEAHVREFNVNGDYVRLARTNFNDDQGIWLRVADLVLIDVLAAKVELQERPPEEKPKRRRRKGGCPADDDGDEGGAL